MFKRLLIAALGTSVLAAGLAACGGSSSPGSSANNANVKACRP